MIILDPFPSGSQFPQCGRNIESGTRSNRSSSLGRLHQNVPGSPGLNGLSQGGLKSNKNPSTVGELQLAELVPCSPIKYKQFSHDHLSSQSISMFIQFINLMPITCAGIREMESKQNRKSTLPLLTLPKVSSFLGFAQGPPPKENITHYNYHIVNNNHFGRAVVPFFERCGMNKKGDPKRFPDQEMRTASSNILKRKHIAERVYLIRKVCWTFWAGRGVATLHQNKPCGHTAEELDVSSLYRHCGEQ